MKSVLKHIPGISLLILNWFVVKKFFLAFDAHNPGLEVLLLFFLSAVEYVFLSFIAAAVSLLFKWHINLSLIKSDVVLQGIALLMVIIVTATIPYTMYVKFGSIIVGLILTAFYSGAHYYNESLKRSPAFKQKAEQVSAFALLASPIAILGGLFLEVFGLDFRQLVLFLYFTPIIFIRAVPFAYSLVEEDRKVKKGL